MKLVINFLVFVIFSQSLMGQKTDYIDSLLLNQLKRDYFYSESYDSSKCYAQLFIDKIKGKNNFLVEKVKLVPYKQMIDFPNINCNYSIIEFNIYDTENMKGFIELYMIDNLGKIYDNYYVEWKRYNLFKKRKYIADIGYKNEDIVIYYYRIFLQKTKLHPFYSKVKYEKIIKIDTIENVFIKIN